MYLKSIGWISNVGCIQKFLFIRIFNIFRDSYKILWDSLNSELSELFLLIGCPFTFFADAFGFFHILSYFQKLRYIRWEIRDLIEKWKRDSLAYSTKFRFYWESWRDSLGFCISRWALTDYYRHAGSGIETGIADGLPFRRRGGQRQQRRHVPIRFQLGRQRRLLVEDGRRQAQQLARRATHRRLIQFL